MFGNITPTKSNSHDKAKYKTAAVKHIIHKIKIKRETGSNNHKTVEQQKISWAKLIIQIQNYHHCFH